MVSPVLHAVAQRRLASHVALVTGSDVDKPWNLATSVTVEQGFRVIDAFSAFEATRRGHPPVWRSHADR